MPYKFIQVGLSLPSIASSFEMLKKSFWEGNSGKLAMKVSEISLDPLDQTRTVILSFKKGMYAGNNILVPYMGLLFPQTTLVIYTQPTDLTEMKEFTPELSQLGRSSALTTMTYN